MARSTFSGPILSGNSKSGPIRDVGYVELIQSVDLNFAATGGNGTVGYAGGSGQFVNGNQIPNVNAVVYVQSSGTYPPVAVTPTVDSATTTFRGAVMYMPVGSGVNDFFVDVGANITVSSGALTTAVVSIGNAFNSTAYGTATLTVTSNAIVAGRYPITFTGAQLTNIQATSADFTNPMGVIEPPTFSQVVFTLTCVGTGTPAPIAGTLFLNTRYSQLDTNIGTTGAYPYGTFA